VEGSSDLFNTTLRKGPIVIDLGPLNYYECLALAMELHHIGVVRDVRGAERWVLNRLFMNGAQKL